MIDLALELGDGMDAVRARLSEWDETGAAGRLWARDTTLWAPDPPPPELADRLGWLDLPERSRARLPELETLRRAIPFWMTDLVLLGMGGSSLAPEVLARTLGAEGLPLTLLDTTHPRAVRDMEWLHPANTVFIVASKSGTTLETLSLFRHFWSRVQEVSDEPGAHFVAITDPGSPLVELGRERRFRAVFEAPPDVGGRYSALSAFGLVPAALMGVDVAALLESADVARDTCRETASQNPGFRLGAALAEMARAGRDKVTFITSSGWTAFPDWAEQLIAESTGKDGNGIVPVAHEPPLEPDEYGADRVFVALTASRARIEEANAWGENDDSHERIDALAAAGHPLIRLEVDEPEHIGALFFVWEVAVAMAGAVLGIHPFDQPDVQLAKRLAKRAMRGGDGESGEEPSPPPAPELDLAWDVAPYGHAPGRMPPDPDVDGMRRALAELVASIGDADYVALQVYLAGGNEEELERLRALREALARATGAATTLGYGPRFLHSTGQLHKGGADNGVFLQIVDDAGPHVHVPDGDFTFGQLIRAQARGDLDALLERGRRVLRVRVDPDGVGLQRLLQLVQERQ